MKTQLKYEKDSALNEEVQRIIKKEQEGKMHYEATQEEKIRFLKQFGYKK